MIHASLFSGIGGPEVAAAMLGWDNAFHCEINPFGRAVLEYWFPSSVSYDDITKTSFTEWRGRIDVLTGGFPCQPFSYAGKRGGREDDRYLWPEMLRAIDEIRPTWVIGENVAGLATMVEGGVLTYLGSETTLFGEEDAVHGYMLRETFTIERICQDLEHIGYSVQPVLIPAAAVGAPHRRDRIFIIAHIADADCCNDMREPGEYEGESRTKRLQERDEIRKSGVSSDVRSEVQRVIGNSVNVRCGKREDGEQRSEWNIRNTGAGNKEWVHRENGAYSADSDCHRGCKVDEHLQSKFADGTEPVGHGREWHATDAYGEGLQEPQQPGRREDSQEEGAGLDDRIVGSCCHGRDASDAERERLEGEDESGNSEGGERMRVRRNTARYDWAIDGGLLPENRWKLFPTVSPIHRGNDGLPFPLDNLAIPQTKWRTESLKAYGNAIVPQVIYEIFKAIETI